MNVPLKKRHNYGKLNGSVSSLNEPSAKRLHSNYSNEEDSEYDRSNMDDSSQNETTTSRHINNDKRPHQYLSISDMMMPADGTAAGAEDESTVVSSSSSVIMSSSEHNDDDDDDDDDESTSSSGDSSDSSKSTKTDESNDQLSECDPLTETAVMRHNCEFEPMNSRERIQFWNIADKCNEIVDDFDDKKYYSKPIRSERLQKRMYTQPVPNFSTSRKYKKDEKSLKTKTDEKLLSSTPTKSKNEIKTANKIKTSPSPIKQSVEKQKENAPPDTELASPVIEQKTPPLPSLPSMPSLPSLPSVPSLPSLPLLPPSKTTVNQLLLSVRPLINNNLEETRPANDIPSTIKFRVSYNKETTIRSNNSFKIPTMSNTSNATIDGECANCSKHGRSMDTSTEIPSHNNQEEFYKYLGIDTNPVQEKMMMSPEPSPTDTLYNNRRSLRVFMQQKQHEFIDKQTKEEQSMCYQMSSTTTENSPNAELNVYKHQTPENGKVYGKITNGTLKSISSHIKQRHTYETSPEAMEDVSMMPTRSISTKETETLATNGYGECSGTMSSDKLKVARIQRRRKILLPSPMMLTEMFKRYQQCFKQSFAMQQQMRSVKKRKFKKRSLNNASNSETEQKTTTNENGEDDKMVKTNGIPQPIDPTREELIDTFSPTSITHSNASTDSAIVINNLNDATCQPPTITLTTSDSLEWLQQQNQLINKSQFRNPLDAKHGTVHAILTHSVSANDDDVIVVIQESQISFWYSTSKVLSMFGMARTWSKIDEISRVNEDKEIDNLYQHRLIDIGEPFPVYVEMRAKESPSNEFRKTNLTFVYLNVYFMKPNADGHPQLVRERVHLDTLKGFANSIYYTALKTTPSILMTWTEQNVNNQTRCGIIKYTLKSTTLDNIEEIFDYSELQHDIKSLYAINDYHVVGCGDRTVSMWDHRNGNLLIDIEIELSTIGQNIACYTVSDDIPEYMLLIQLMSDEKNEEIKSENEEINKQLKVMAVQTVNPYNWRTLQTHNIPCSYGKIRSIFNKDDMLTITFENGTMLFLNISSPHKIYVRDVSWPKMVPQINGINALKHPTNKCGELFAQSNGQTFEIFNDRIAIKSIWEYFINNNN